MGEREHTEERVEEFEVVELGSVSEETQGGWVRSWEIVQPLP